ncbi:transcription initiation factor TFIID subunit 7-like [Salvelinus fontinalis]|uniref:transcription initiation factor TFIID subunit 7-like n=1 Tax=Salvelinus fontinalis TaxID=8038 RepID=UPI002485DECC|nr:transcription initiation factor TFIID subunit 7-like [Salvelinus fontinalis]
MNLKDRFSIELHGDGHHGVMLVCTLDEDLYAPLEEPTGTVDPKKKKVKDKVKIFVWNHGTTCPLKNTRKRRFKKIFKKQYIESPDMEKVKRLLSTDAEAVSVRWEVIAEDETKEAENKGCLVNLDSSDGAWLLW